MEADFELSTLLERLVSGAIPVTVELGTVESVEESEAFGRLLNVTVRPSGRTLQARPVVYGAGENRGAWWPIAADDEVLVLLPQGDNNRAVALLGLPSKAAPPPDGWDNTRPVIAHPDGMDVRGGDSSLVMEDGEAVLTGGSSTITSDNGGHDIKGSLTEVHNGGVTYKLVRADLLTDLLTFVIGVQAGFTVFGYTVPGASDLISNLPTGYRTSKLKAE